MGVNCESLMETYKRNNGFTTILTWIMFRILNMENEQGKENIKIHHWWPYFIKKKMLTNLYKSINFLISFNKTKEHTIWPKQDDILMRLYFSGEIL